eukprot:TRINITY_DN12152_c0_g2_i13.p1 TRINITY_DN12152_c0_g2~~TRINITY_DN12152_c0_g2_i13.p1  ORF type:complete len:237 (+),score=41.89 TRINITY_DN12152_c0_g2_i13:690-1400(+)
MKRSVVLEMIDKIKAIKQEGSETLHLLEKEMKIVKAEDDVVGEADVEYERSQCTENGRTYSLLHEMNTKKILELETTVRKQEFKNKLAAIVLILDRSSKFKGSMSNAIRMLNDLSKENEFMQVLTECLMCKQLAFGLDEDAEIYKEFRSSVNRARLGAFVRQNETTHRYFLGLVSYFLFGKYKFVRKIEEYIGNCNAELVNDLRHLGYLEEYLREQKYEAALIELEKLNVTSRSAK